MSTEAPEPQPLRHRVVSELHARPFPTVPAPATVHFIALRPETWTETEPQRQVDLLRELARRTGVGAGPPDGALPSQWSGRLGRWTLKWERHTEFSTFLAWVTDADGDVATPFDPDWLAESGSEVIASNRLLIARSDDDDEIRSRALSLLSNETLAMSRMLEDAVVVAGDFSLDAEERMTFAIFPRRDCGDQRIGRVVQRVCELETYRAMAMLGFLRARDLSGDLTAIEGEIGAISAAMVSRDSNPQEALDSLLALAGRIEDILARAEFRFAATRAYRDIVADRVSVLRESRFEGRQTFAEFMSRRFDPAMRTVASTERRLERLSERARRIGELLRTRVEVERSQENRALLASMDRRSDQALKLQHTVEGLSVVAISYYATGLLLYVVAPFAAEAGVSRAWTAAALSPLVVLMSWLLLRRLRRLMR